MIIVREGKETDEFWDFLGGEEEYASMPRLAVSCEHCLAHFEFANIFFKGFNILFNMWLCDVLDLYVHFDLNYFIISNKKIYVKLF